ELGRLCQELLGTTSAARPAAEPLAENILFGDDNVVGPGVAVLQLKDCQANRLGRQGRHLRPGGHLLEWADAVLLKQHAEPVARTGGVGCDDRATAIASRLREPFAYGFVQIDIWPGADVGEVQWSPPTSIDHVIVGRIALELGQRCNGTLGKAGFPTVSVQIQAVRRHRTVRSATAGYVRALECQPRGVMLRDQL